MSLNYSFAGKSVLITGGTSGIGRQLVQRFYEDGAKVYTVGKTPEKVQKLKKELPNVVAEVVDLGDWDATRKVIQSFGVIDHLVNNAVTHVPEQFLNITKEASNSQFDVNIGAIINVSQVVAKGLIDTKREGSIVNISSTASRFADNTVGMAVYAATKAGVEDLTKSMALELGAHKIRVNCIAPGIVETPMALAADKVVQDFVQNVVSRMVVKRMIRPDEIADSVMFLLSPLSSMIVGESVVVDGGFLVT